MTDKIRLRALREMVGLSQQDLASALSVDVRTVKRWEQLDNDWLPRQFALDYIVELWLRQCRAVDAALAHAEDNLLKGSVIQLPYWHSDRHWNEYGSRQVGEVDPWTWKCANAASRALATAFVSEGYQVEFTDGLTDFDDFIEV